MNSISTSVALYNIEDLQMRLVGEQAQFINGFTIAINKGLHCIISDFILPPNNDIIEEKAVLNYFNNNDKLTILITYLFDQNISGVNHSKVIQLEYNSIFFDNYANDLFNSHKLFLNKKNIEQAFSIHALSREHVDKLLQKKDVSLDFNAIIDFEITALNLLKFALKGYSNPDEANSYPACSFLNNNQEREKILLAKKIINDNLNNPLTIRALARECGINECYLKKGFKAMFGKTIHEYREYKRIEKSKELILKGNYNINEVAAEMGYTSHAYFSTAFKKIAGIKPCDLLA